MDKEAVLKILNKIMEYELAGVVRYTHYQLMVFGYHRIPIVNWLKEQATESLGHAGLAGEYITLLGGHPSLGIGPLLESHKHQIGDLLKESMEHENAAKNLYYELLKLVEGKSVLLEEYARDLIVQEELHTDQVNKMLRDPGSLTPFNQ